MNVLHELPEKWRNKASRLSTHDGVAIGKRACADELEASLQQAAELVAPFGYVVEGRILAPEEATDWAKKVGVAVYTTPPVDTAALLDVLREAWEFFGHYSSVNEACQDEMAAERNAILDKMERTFATGEKNSGR